MFRFLLVAALLTVPTAVGDQAEPARPAAAFAWEGDNGTLISWAPGTSPADHYNVYGVVSGARVLLAVAPDTMFAEVSNAFRSYEVTAVVGGAESSPVAVLSGINGPCVTIFWNPPGVAIGCMGSVLALYNDVPGPGGQVR